MDIEIKNLKKTYNGRTVLEDLSLTIKEGEVTCIMAPSGQGKTTLLRILMGLETADEGEIRGLAGKKTGAVFQEDRLCRNLSPVSNIRLVCRQGAKAEVKAEILEAMEAVGLSGCAGQPVRELSGGMKRRTAILRALFSDSEILFLDEPFKGLDEETKQKTMEYTREKCAGRTVLMVTHDLSEAQFMVRERNDRICRIG